MDETTKAYLRNLIPESTPDGRKILVEGLAIGKTVNAGKSRFQREKGYASDVDYRREMKEKGEMVWGIIMGLSSVDEQVKGMEYLYEFGKRTGKEIDLFFVIANMLTGLPRDLREKAPKGTSFVCDKPEDWRRMAEAAPISVCFGDFHLGSPNSLENTIRAVEYGSSYSGVLSQISWDFPFYNNDLEFVSSVLKALGVLASKWDEKYVVNTYYDDGIPGYFMDYASYLGYGMFERYIVTDLCGARYSASYGQLMSMPAQKTAFTMACAKVFDLPDQPGVNYVYSNAIDHWDHDIEANYGISLQEYLMLILANKKYHIGCRIETIPITEKIAVPTPEAIANMQAAAQRLEEKAGQWERMMDFSWCEEMRDLLIEKGTQFFNNILKGLQEAGLDTKDPLQMLMILRRIDAIKMEKIFHPSIRENADGAFTPYVPTTMGQQCQEIQDGIVQEMLDAGYSGKLSGKRIVVVSADAHYYGSFVVCNVLSALGADVVNGGVDFDTVDVLDLAEEEDPDYVCISVHNGQALDFAKQLMELSRERPKQYPVFMGGKLNGILPGATEPTDVSYLVGEMGVTACQSLQAMVDYLAKPLV